MKWQRARVLSEQPNPIQRGTLVWVEKRRPVQFWHIDGHRMFKGYRTHVRAPRGGQFCIPRSDVELLPEFSDADNPDEEICQ